MKNELIQLTNFIESYTEFNQHSLDNDVIGIGNRLDFESNTLTDFNHNEDDYFGENAFTLKYEIDFRYTSYLCEANYSALGLGLKNPEKDKDGLNIVSKKQMVNVLRKFIKSQQEN